MGVYEALVLSLASSLEINPSMADSKDAYQNVEKWAKTEKACVSSAFFQTFQADIYAVVSLATGSL